jgi:hypothetical protein
MTRLGTQISDSSIVSRRSFPSWSAMRFVCAGEKRVAVAG